MRTFYDKPLRDWVEEGNSEKITLEEFRSHLNDSGFWEEMVNHPAGQDKYIEEWYETLAAWHDIKTN